MQLSTSQKLNNFQFKFLWSYKELFAVSIVLYSLVFMFLLVSLTGCSKTPKVIVKKEYIQKPTPVLQTVPVNELNLSKDRELKLHIKVKEKK